MLSICDTSFSATSSKSGSWVDWVGRVSGPAILLWAQTVRIQNTSLTHTTTTTNVHCAKPLSILDLHSQTPQDIGTFLVAWQDDRELDSPRWNDLSNKLVLSVLAFRWQTCFSVLMTQKNSLMKSEARRKSFNVLYTETRHSKIHSNNSCLCGAKFPCFCGL